ncbi:D-aminoacylase [Candidatus Acetothermia bacterium]|nr:D-aminoacylase [Candidatus Acetothermia bacterium]MCI2426912.1 D-aminoacylase [Candidatus Acetothermia bacterium]MCI2428357.1 D-aminoacylase [Candidatus Acetothermia bacterium]
MSVFDVILKNAKIIDGSGNPWFWGDLGIANGRIEKIGKIKTEEAVELKDLKGLVVCPGFIDMHSHSDLPILVNPTAESKVMQGVTTEVIGNCGFSAVPVTNNIIEHLKEYGDSLAKKLDWNWRSLRDYLDRLNKISINIVPLIGQGTIRIAVMGFDSKDPTKRELERMKGLLRDALDEGAVGLSTGLIYPPGSFTKTEELIELVKIVKEYNGLYSTHIRGEGGTLVEAFKEAIRIGRESGVRVEVSHHKAVGIQNWGRVQETLELIERAREEGIDITCDQYPYTASSTSLSACLPPWAHEGGGHRLLERLKDPYERKRITEYIERREDWDNVIRQSNWSRIRIATVNSEKNKNLEGKTLEEIAQVRAKDPFNVVFDLLLEEKGNVSIIIFEIDEDDLRRVMRHPSTMIGSDGSCLTPKGIMGRGKPHPRNYGTYPRVLGRYVREENILTLEEAIRKMTSFPAQKLGLKDRGLLKEGYFADIVVFDPQRINDRANYEDPHQFPEGIEYVLVRGEIVVEKGEHTGRTPGDVLRNEL